MFALALQAKLGLRMFYAADAPSTATDFSLERVRARDPLALNGFFDRYFPMVYALVFRLAGRRDLAEDLTQDVFFRVYRRIGRIDPQRDPVPWLMTIAYNVFRDYWRSRPARAERRTISLDASTGVIPEPVDPTPGPEEERQRSARESLVQQALSRLPEPSRLIVLMHDYIGLTHEEIARSMNIAPAAARKRYSRALRDLERLLRGVS